jgi:hypothetical protein
MDSISGCEIPFTVMEKAAKAGTGLISQCEIHFFDSEMPPAPRLRLTK